MLNIITFCILIIIPYHQIFNINYLEVKESDLYKKTYDQAYIKFEKVYELANPMTYKSSIEKHIEKLKSLGKKNEEINIPKLENFDIFKLYFKNHSEYGYNIYYDYNNIYDINNNGIHYNLSKSCFLPKKNKNNY